MNFKHYIIFIALLIFLSSCNYRTSSNKRFENITNISLPDSIIVLQDRFEDSGPDFGLFYEIRLQEKDYLDITDQLSKLKGWDRYDNSNNFQKTENGIIYIVSLLKNENIIIYQEELI